MKKIFVIACVLYLLADFSFGAITPSKQGVFPTIGRGQGFCVNNICSQWRVDLSVYYPDVRSFFNPEQSIAQINFFFLERDKENVDFRPIQIYVNPGETKHFSDALYNLQGFEKWFGSLVFSSSEDVVVFINYYDANVSTPKGVGPSGQIIYPQSIFKDSIGKNQRVDIIGFSQNIDWRSHIGFVEVSGNSVLMDLILFSEFGQILGYRQNVFIRPFEAKQINNFFLSLGVVSGENCRLRIFVKDGEGRILSLGSLVNNKTGDLSMLEPIVTILTPPPPNI